MTYYTYRGAAKVPAVRAAVLASLADDDALVEAGARALWDDVYGGFMEWDAAEAAFWNAFLARTRAVLRAIADHANQEGP